MVKIDKKDRMILFELDKDPRINVSKLAKKIGVSRQVAEYRLNKLISQKTIYAFYTLIDLGRLGYSSFRVHLRLKNVKDSVYKEFAKQLFAQYPTFWVGFISGSFDLIIDFFARDLNDFDKIFSRLLEDNKDIIQNYNILPILNLNLYNYGYFLENKGQRYKKTIHKIGNLVKIDEKDKLILKELKNNCRLPYEIIGRKVDLTRNAVKARINRLEKEGLINGYKIIVNFNHFDYSSFKIFIKYNTSKIDKEKQLLDELVFKEGVLATLKFLGKWDLDIEIHAKNVSELQKYIITLRNDNEIIQDYEIVQIIEDYGIDFYPNEISA